MMKYLLFLIPFLLYADNEVRISIGCQITINSEGTIPRFRVDFSSFNLVQPDGKATIVITSTPLILKTLPTTKTVEASFNLHARPNQFAKNGYIVAVNIMPMFINLDVQSPAFERFRPISLTGTTSVLNADFPGMNIWFQRVTSETFTTGIQLSSTWKTDNAIVSTESVNSEITYTIRFPTDNIRTVQPGVYWIQLQAAMDPYIASPSQIAANNQEIVTQINAIDAYIAQIDAELGDQNDLFKLNLVQKNTLIANRKVLVSQRSAVVDANKGII